ncbi:conserved hypothetical protein [Leishmania braziliensis MHOM/BR/75/M2904]|uniref:PNPLA domain-containing protein n=2 Tax=Leishmania braziliensis TaxID=5660 RepID=A4HB80_LEIBR|nr:conserved hypothetical protein [Leishmania braziliensis MHOM/BR/75/M2904]KAI5686592.1 hypothetical protein MNV84_03233 [Leishmania braziliensis]CAJ2471635.1 unnamed protein product [Leishmania braziliensis]CAJ2472226.1 unnamed protein product [Leishmania braziliensis]CAM38666.1 conserved hypothetical protein [Leishmania braziliensis MHOM/BR/75/M2904]SYZ65368.1 Domain_of_uncharacterised_function_(DUF3336)/Patatin-like_phospholipase [Leishmania braziliensis MHOM/BR/75/M2904]
MDSTLHAFRVHGAALYHWMSYVAYVIYSCLFFACEVIAGVLEIPTNAPQYDALTHQANCTTSYEEWLPIASTLDDMDGFQKWRTDEASTYFSFEGVMRTIEELLELRTAGSVEALLDDLQKHVHRSLYGISHRRLYSYRTGSKTVIHSYNSLVCFLLGRVGEAARTDRRLAVRTREVFSEMYHVYGTTALLLQGGVLASSAHFGVAKALYDAGLLPAVLYGSGSGALVATLVCCCTDLTSLFHHSGGGSSFVEAHALFGMSTADSRWKHFHRLLHTGEVCDPVALADFLQRTIGDVTFAEAYAQTGRVLNIPFVAVSSVLPRRKADVDVQLLNYLTSPDVLIRSAVICAISSPSTLLPVSSSSCGSSAGAAPPTRTLLARTRLTGTIVAYEPPVVHESYSCSWGDHAGYGALDPLQRMRGLFCIRFCVVSDASVRGYLWQLLHQSAYGDGLRHHTRMWDWARYLFALYFLGLAHVLLRLLAWIGYNAIAAPSPTSMRTFFEDDESENVRVHPISSVWSYLRLCYSPTTANMQVLVLEAERQVWPRLEQLRMSISVEQALAATLKRLPVSR